MPSVPSPKLELKYCERCGGLWFRPQGGAEVYCAQCAERMQELPAVKPARRAVEAAVPMILIAAGALDALASVCGGAL